MSGTIELLAGETKNDDARDVPIIPQLRALLVGQHAKRQPNCPHVCLRLDRRGNAVKIRGFRKAWYSACIRSGLGRMELKVDRVTGEPLYTSPRGPRSKPKTKMIYRGTIFHDLRRVGARSFDRYKINSRTDFVDAGKKLEIFHNLKVGDNSGTIDSPLNQVQTLPYRFCNNIGA